jgi:predicted alpha-1,2-mannosidase
MKRVFCCLLVVYIALVLSASASGQTVRLGDAVDPFIGVDGGGNVVCGAGVPFGFAWLSPDTLAPSTSGYRSDHDIVGFSHTHVSGTGGESKYGNFRVTPWIGELMSSELRFKRMDETAAPGYYAVTLVPGGIHAELTATHYCGVHRYTFPHTDKAWLLLDAGSVIQPGTQPHPDRQHVIETTVRIIPPDRIEGTGHFAGGWNPGAYTLHFAAKCERPFASYGTWREGRFQPGVAAAHGTGCGAYVGFDTREDAKVRLAVGVSFVSVEQARAHLDEEVGKDVEFERVRHRAADAWEHALSSIVVRGGTPTERKLFYTALYHCHLMPHDVSGENVWWSSAEPHYEDFYCLWDTFRCLHPLLTVIEPERQRDMVRSLIDTYAHTGWIPDARIAGANGLTQGGSNGDVLIADAAVKGLTGIDYHLAYEALKKDAEAESSRPRYEGRQLSEYHKLGYMSTDLDRSATRTLEYAYDDFCVAEVAHLLGYQSDSDTYLHRSRNWLNLWDPTTMAIRPRHANGTWLEPFTRLYANGSWNGPFYEGNAWQYSTYVPHDVPTLIQHVGGDAAFVAWLDDFFEHGVYTHDNEPDILAPWLYIHAGRPDRTVDRVRHILATCYRPTRNGLDGNDDAGCMSSWYVWAAIGLYPNAGQPYYYIGSPLFSSARIDLGNHRSFTIRTEHASPANRYVQSATLNSKPLERAWLRHEELEKGGVLTLFMGPTLTAWGRDQRPPSYF